jgi:hypothetical protein
MNAKGESIKTSSLKSIRWFLRQTSSSFSKKVESTIESSSETGLVLRSDYRRAEITCRKIVAVYQSAEVTIIIELNVLLLPSDIALLKTVGDTRLAG